MEKEEREPESQVSAELSAGPEFNTHTLGVCHGSLAHCQCTVLAFLGVINTSTFVDNTNLM